MLISSVEYQAGSDIVLTRTFAVVGARWRRPIGVLQWTAAGTVVGVAAES
jgi:hypothetical protein